MVGRSDDIGAYPAERPVTPAEVVATVYESLGINLETTLPGPQGKPQNPYSPRAIPYLPLTQRHMVSRRAGTLLVSPTTRGKARCASDDCSS